jgi:hypothetical protein
MGNHWEECHDSDNICECGHTDWQHCLYWPHKYPVAMDGCLVCECVDFNLSFQSIVKEARGDVEGNDV